MAHDCPYCAPDELCALHIMPVKHETDPARKVLFVFRDTPANREALEQRAIREQTTPSDIMRRALASYLEDNSCTPAGRPSVTKQGSSDGD